MNKIVKADDVDFLGVEIGVCGSLFTEEKKFF